MRRLVAPAFVLLLVFFGAASPLVLHYLPYLFAANEARSLAQTLASDVAVMQIADVNHTQINELKAKMDLAGADIELLRQLLRDDPLVGLVRHIDATTPVLNDLDALLDAGTAISRAGEIALELGNSFVSLREASAGTGAQESLLANLVNLMATSTVSVDQAHDLIVGARGLLASISPDAPSQIRHLADQMSGPLDKYGPLLDQYRAVDDVLPQILGWHDRRRYLVLAQDPAELRPTGGYTGTFGTVTFDDGGLSDRTFQDVNNLDLLTGLPFVEPPEALSNHLLGDMSWQLGDANWSPDFPTAAQDALRLYSLESGDTDIDGVIALNTYAIDRLLQVTGPIEVPDYGVTVPPGATTLISLYMTRAVPTPTGDRKAFLSALADVLLDRLYSLPQAQWPSLYEAFSEISDQRDLQAWFKDPPAQALVAGSAVGGSVRQDAGDYVYVVEANVAPTSKYNLVVQRRDALAVAIAPNGDATSALRLDWQDNAMDPGPINEFLRSYSTSSVGIYGAYVRVYTPAPSELISTNGMASDPISAVESTTQEAGRNVFGNYLLIPPGAADLSYNWVTPGVATEGGGEWTYTLTIQKQSGLTPMPLSVTVTLPSGATITSTSLGATAADGTVVLATTLTQDAQLQVKYRLP